MKFAPGLIRRTIDILRSTVAFGGVSTPSANREEILATIDALESSQQPIDQLVDPILRDAPAAPRSILVTTLYGRDNKIPMVQIEVPDGKAQLNVETTEELIRNLSSAVQASLTDAFLIEFFRQPAMDLEDGQVWTIIRDFRQWREVRIAELSAGASAHG